MSDPCKCCEENVETTCCCGTDACKCPEVCNCGDCCIDSDCCQLKPSPRVTSSGAHFAVFVIVGIDSITLHFLNFYQLHLF